MNRRKIHKPVENIKKTRKVYTIEEKMEVIRKWERGERTKNICLAMNMKSSTVCTILKMSEQIKKQYESAIGAGKLHRLTKSRHSIFIEFEKFLVQWIDTHDYLGLPLSSSLIKERAIQLFSELKEKKTAEGDTTVKDIEFKASSGWFDRFCTRSQIKNLKLYREVASDSTDAASAFPKELKKIIDKGGYTPHQIFNIDETGLFWKRMPSCTSISKEDARSKGYKASMDRLTLLLGGNCAGDIKLKPLLVYHSETPRALKRIAKSSLPVMWRSNQKAWVTQDLFNEYIHGYMSPFIKNYTEERNLANKALLIIDNAPAHSSDIGNLCDNIQVVFLPLNSTPLLQPMDQGGIRAFKSHYLQLLMQYLTYSSVEDENISIKTMNAIWKKLLPQYVANLDIDEVVEIKTNIVALAKMAGMEEVEVGDIDELLSSHSEELTLDEMIELQRHFKSEDQDEKEDEEEMKSKEKILDDRSLKELLDTADKLTNIAVECDRDMTRSITFKNAIMNACECYRKLYRCKVQACKQVPISTCFNPKSVRSFKDDISKPSTSGIQATKKRKLSESLSSLKTKQLSCSSSGSGVNNVVPLEKCFSPKSLLQLCLHRHQQLFNHRHLQ
ncbi:tigger transposable element-derived protein 1-like [Centruroides sculpturatus]|uniref:tigger transposable element-derived protein 1-like n=1 Tax=Centruroides sculpturatus TaxID=218467 RepID=UPI000C6DDF95|nr:tigger transposable element-derived protein 1-like [Centruroides sculpturatus]